MIMPTYREYCEADRAADMEFARAHGLDPSQVTHVRYGTDEYFIPHGSTERKKVMHVRFELIMPMVISPRGIDLTAYGVPFPGPRIYPPAPEAKKRKSKKGKRS